MNDVRGVGLLAVDHEDLGVGGVVDERHVGQPGLARRLVRPGHDVNVPLADARQAALDEAEQDHAFAILVEAVVAVVRVHAVRGVTRKVGPTAPEVERFCVVE